MIPRFIVILSATVLSACATPAPPTITAFDADRAFDQARAIRALPLTATPDLPLGAVIYEGAVGADVIGDAQGSILGDLAMRVDFDDGDIDGAITDINLIGPDGVPDQMLQGALDIDGTTASGRLGAQADGRISAVDADRFTRDAEMQLSLQGDVFDDQTPGDAIFGTVDGTARGDLYLDIDGVFFGRAE